ncbi:Asp23/Gls24 family envelope stress response protein [Streptomyces sp. 5-8]|uniref:Asp23/Gls24 family envelope stress response protein n=1 Tax=Streptomyces musisoli TaxID=2802280 RepID=A0ABS1PDB3_9ACTN|nr:MULTISPECIES: Asp23/Gls24 family envelope stress response protein [Streptomyces]MBL1110374.1 Asp23/Gls24 family envelope stress response protein [Streptomyces musisoli]MBY8846659.1 Asp23/Gls24 family envelope stress response protein [Streptomyces sp. SP2-10]
MAVDHPLSPDEELTCGRLLSQVWDQALNPAPAEDPHTMTCPSCHEAIASLAALKAATRALRGQAPTYLQSLAHGVMNIVRSEARLGRLLPLADPVLDLRIAESAAAKVLRQAADNVPGVRAAACRLAPADNSDAADGVAVALTLAASLDRPLPERTDEVRRAVIHAAERTIGLHVTAVDITVIEALDPPHTPDPPSPGSAPPETRDGRPRHG